MRIVEGWYVVRGRKRERVGLGNEEVKNLRKGLGERKMWNLNCRREKREIREKTRVRKKKFRNWILLSRSYFFRSGDLRQKLRIW